MMGLSQCMSVDNDPNACQLVMITIPQSRRTILCPVTPSLKRAISRFNVVNIGKNIFQLGLLVNV